MAVDLPGPLYLDTSALVKLYLPEAASERVNEIVAGRRDLAVSDLAVTEVVSAIARRRRGGEVSVRIAARLHRAILRDVEAGLFRRAELTAASHRSAERLLLALEGAPLRAADALHLALAIEEGAATVLTFDGRMREAAPLFGLEIWPD